MALHDINNFLLPKHCIGTVERVGTGKIIVHVTNETMLQSLQMHEMVIVSGSDADEKLIGIVTEIVKRNAENIAVGAGSADVGNYCAVYLTGSFSPKYGDGKNAKFKRVIHTYPEINSEVFQVNEPALRMIMNTKGSGAADGESLQIGCFAGKSEIAAMVDGNRFFQRHACIAGNTGSGKSYVVAQILEKADKLPHSNMIVLDWQGEYQELSYAKHIKISDDADGADISFSANALKAYLEKQRTSESGQKAASPIGKNTVEDSHWIRFAQQILGNTEKRIKILDLSMLSGDMRLVAAGAIAKMLYEIQRSLTLAEGECKNTLVLVCEEAHCYMADAVAGRSAAGTVSSEIFEMVAREGRKYGIGLLAVTQSLAQLNAGILSQCNNMLSLRLTDAADKSVVASRLPEALSGIADMLPELAVGECIAIGDAVMLPAKVILSQPEEKPKGTTMAYWSRWSDGEDTAPDIAAAARCWVKKLRE